MTGAAKENASGWLLLPGLLQRVFEVIPNECGT